MSKKADRGQMLFTLGESLVDSPKKEEQWKGVDLIHQAARLGCADAIRYLDYHSNPDNN